MNRSCLLAMALLIAVGLSAGGHRSAFGANEALADAPPATETGTGSRESSPDGPAVEPAGDEAFPVALSLVPEMGYIPEVDDWEFCPADAFPEHAADVQAAWKALAEWAGRQVTPQRARALSRWARPQMAAYDAVPPPARAALEPARRQPQRGRLVYELTVDTLPTHHPVVTRWLKVYLLYDPHTKAILRMTVTIRGERLE